MRIRKSRKDPRFNKLYERLPTPVQTLARKQFRDWQAEGFPITGWLSPLKRKNNFLVCRIDRRWRAVAYLKDDVLIWTWIGSHEDYNNFLGEF